MDDLISRQAAIEALRTCQTYLFDIHDTDKKISLESAEFEIEQLPSAQPEIIRCKDCKYYTSVTARCEVRGKGLYLIRGMEDFCSRAERRTDGTDARSDIG